MKVHCGQNYFSDLWHRHTGGPLGQRSSPPSPPPTPSPRALTPNEMALRTTHNTLLRREIITRTPAPTTYTITVPLIQTYIHHQTAL